ncbi:MAG: thioredoxin domain-containing protein, partial [Gemmatimonadetes bacterium]|nr:thioredoxin domain-containing protein [Gemmatimonadota bacterium]
LFQRAYDVTKAGNFEGRNILHLPHDLDAVARAEDMSRKELDESLKKSAAVLKAQRAEREPPGLDDKILAGWNGMMMRALSEVGTAHERPDLVSRAIRTGTFLRDHMKVGDTFFRVFAGGTSAVPGFLEDYAAFGNGSLSLYEATLDPSWLDLALWSARTLADRFWEEEEGIFYDAGPDGEALLVRPRDIMDNATPSGSSLAVELLARLTPLSNEARFASIVDGVLEREAGTLQRYPTALARLTVAGIRAQAPMLEISVAGRGDEALAMVQAAHGTFHANRVISGGDPNDSRVAGLPTMEGRLDTTPRAHVCVGQRCLEPVSDADALKKQLEDV